jgi:hemoglobin
MHRYLCIMAASKDISSDEDIVLLVDTFYTNIRQDKLLGPIFGAIINDRWPEHLDKMYRFWQTVLLEKRNYSGSPFPPHAQMAIDKHHFDTWLSLWRATLDGLFAGPLTEEAKWRAEKMAVMFLSKIEYYRNHPGFPLM